MKKSELRTLYLERRSSYSLAQISEASARITELFFDSVDLNKVERFHCFIPIAKFSEIDTLPIFHRLWESYTTIETFAPRSNLETGEIESAYFTLESALVENKWGIREPVGKGIADAESIDMVLVPLVCFDMRGHRVGYGKGFYDRFLAECRKGCMKIGLSFFGPENVIDNVDEHDVTLDLFITPDGLIEPPK